MTPEDKELVREIVRNKGILLDRGMGLLVLVKFDNIEERGVIADYIVALYNKSVSMYDQDQNDLDYQIEVIWGVTITGVHEWSAITSDKPGLSTTPKKYDYGYAELYVEVHRPVLYYAVAKTHDKYYDLIDQGKAIKNL